MNARSWKETAQKGVVLAKPMYAAQLAVYQAYMEASVAGISAHPALFTAINKDTAELHHELVPFDGALAQRMSDKAVRIFKDGPTLELASPAAPAALHARRAARRYERDAG